MGEAVAEAQQRFLRQRKLGTRLWIAYFVIALPMAFFCYVTPFSLPMKVTILVVVYEVTLILLASAAIFCRRDWERDNMNFANDEQS